MTGVGIGPAPLFWAKVSGSPTSALERSSSPVEALEPVVQRFSSNPPRKGRIGSRASLAVTSLQLISGAVQIDNQFELGSTRGARRFESASSITNSLQRDSFFGNEPERLSANLTALGQVLVKLPT